MKNQLFAALLALTCCSGASGAVLTFQFEGTAFQLFGNTGDITVDSVVTGTFAYDTNTPLSGTSGAQSRYAGAVVSGNLSVAGYTFQLASTGFNTASVTNDAFIDPTTVFDEFLLFFSVDATGADFAVDPQVSIRFSGGPSSIDSGDLPMQVDTFSSSSAIIRLGGVGDNSAYFAIDPQSITQVPLPGGLMLLLSAVGICSVATRKRR